MISSLSSGQTDWPCRIIGNTDANAEFPEGYNFSFLFYPPSDPTLPRSGLL